MMRKVSSFDIRQSYTSDKARIDLSSHLWIHLVLRPISFRLTPLFVNAGFSANAVTSIGFTVLIVGLAFVACGAYSYPNFIIGAVLVNTWVLLDCIDGDIARYRKTASQFGAMLDFLTGFVYHSFLFICLGIGLYLGDDRSMSGLGYGLPAWVFLGAGFIGSHSVAFRKVVTLGFRSFSGDRPQADAKLSLWALLPRAIISFKAPLLLIAALAQALGCFLLIYAAYNVATLFAVTILSLRQALLADPGVGPGQDNEQRGLPNLN